MQNQKVSTIIGIGIIVATAVVLFGGVFAWQYYNGEISNTQLPISNQNSNTEAKPCIDTAMTQYDMNICAGNLAETADKNLNDLYQKIKEQLDSKSLHQFIIAEQAWINYRDEDCKAQYMVYDGGSGGPSAEALCIEQLTNERIKEMKNVYGDYVPEI